MLDLPGPISSYLHAKNAYAIDGMLATLAPDAVVIDEDERYVGHPAIRAWMEETTRKYRVTVDPQDAATVDGTTVMSALVSGDFPGSPAMLRYRFTLAGSAISALTIVR